MKVTDLKSRSSHIQKKRMGRNILHAKSEFTEEIYKEVIAFANTDGGVYVRQGTSSAQASSEQIRQMIKENDGLFTNLALLMSDQCQHTIKLAVFGDDQNTSFKDDQEFKGSIFRQIDDAFHYIMLNNRTSSDFKGLERIEKSDYPEAALREALLNSVVHRDYSFSGSIMININDKQMEFLSIGGLLPGLMAEDIRSGISQPRNKNLAEVFHRLKLIEAYGTGIRRIYKLYENCSVQPCIEVTHNTFKMVLPNISVAEPLPGNTYLTPQKEQILDFISRNGQITEAEIMEMLIKRSELFSYQHKHFYLFSKSGFTKGCVDRAKRSRLGLSH